MTKHYRKIPTPGHSPTEQELHDYLARIARLGQMDHYNFSGGGVPGVLVAGILFVLAAVVASLVLIYG